MMVMGSASSTSASRSLGVMARACHRPRCAAPGGVALGIEEHERMVARCRRGVGTSGGVEHAGRRRPRRRLA